MGHKSFWWVLLIGASMASASADTLFTNGVIYTLDEQSSTVSRLCVSNSGRLKSLEACEPIQKIDLSGQVVIPGFVEGHGHLMGYGEAQLNLNLATAKNLGELVAQVAEAVDKAEPGEWILGRGWHQSKWNETPKMVDGFQTNETLNGISPDNPVYLKHASGHAAFVNDRALAIAGIDEKTQVAGDGEIIRDPSGRATGVLNERAQNLVSRFVPALSRSQRERALDLALEGLARVGITSFQDAGASQDDIRLYQAFLNEDRLTTRVYAMITGGDSDMLADWMQRGPLMGAGDDKLTVRSIKLVADGALGSRGAWLLEPYSDRAGHSGLPTMPVAEMSDISHLAYRNGFQVAIHAIGDRANREVLDIFDALFDGRDRGVRFRVEHAQHLHPEDIPRFGQLGVIPSMQGIHMSSDRPWAIDRLGAERIASGAYMWKSLIESGAVLVNGTDVPVEPVNPFASYYALVTRMTLAGYPEVGFEPSERLNRETALKTYTINPAFGAFEEALKGSLEPGKVADFIVLDRDLMTVAPADIADTKVLMTVMNGAMIYKADSAMFQPEAP